MPINNIPGVGPTNADIATAVAAPSSSTIATAVAAAVPTISAINTAVANNAPSPNAWVHLGTFSLNNSAGGTVSFSAYRKIKIVVSAIQGAGADMLCLQLNGDSASNYGWQRVLIDYPSWFSSNGSSDSIRLTDNNHANSNYVLATIEIDNATLSQFKPVNWEINYFSVSLSTGVRLSGNGIYRSSSPITSVRVFNIGNQVFSANANNSFQVFGVN